MKKSWLWFLISFPFLVNAQSHFQIHQLRVAGEILSVRPADFEQDGSRELCVFYIRKKNQQSQKFLTIFWAEDQNRYLNKNSFTLRLPKDYIFYDTGMLPGETERVLVFLTLNQAVFYRWKNHQLEGANPLVSFSRQLVQIPSSTQIISYDFFYDWNQDGKDEILVPGMNQALLFYFQQGRWSSHPIYLPAQVRFFSFSLPGLMEHPEITVNYELPAFYLEDWDSDGSKELFAVKNKKIWIYKKEAQGIFSSQPCARITYPLQLTSSQRRRSQINIQVKEIDRDNKADLIVSLQQGGIFNQKAELKIYLGKDRWSRARDFPSPSRSWTFNAWIVGPFFRDFDSDQDLDLVIPTIYSGFITTAKIFLTGSIPLEWQYYFLENGTYPPQANFIDKIDLRIDFTEGRMTSGVPNVFADFNGDGIDDIIYSKSEKELVVQIRDKKARRTNQMEIIQVPASTIPLTKDLNRDGLDDIYLYDIQGDSAHQGVINVLINLGGW